MEPPFAFLTQALRPAELFFYGLFFLTFTHLNEAVKLLLRTDDLVVPVAHTGSGGNEVSYNHIFLQTSEVILLGAHRCLVEDLGGFLEGCR